MLAKLDIFRETGNFFPKILSSIIKLPFFVTNVGLVGLVRSVGLTVIVEKSNHFLQIVCEDDALAEVATDESLLLKMTEKGFQFIPESLHAVHDDPFVVIGKRTLSSDGEHLVEGAYTARKGNEHIALLCHDLFALCECGA